MTAIKPIRRTFGILILLATTWSLSAQTIADPNDPMYAYLTIWQEKGYLKQIPIIRPYPLQTIDRLLREVLDHADDLDRTIARRYLDSLCRESRETRMSPAYVLSTTHAGVSLDAILDGSDLYGRFRLQLDATGYLEDWFSYSGEAAFSLTDAPGTSFFPKWTRVLDDSLAGGGVLSIGPVTLTVGQLSQFGLFLGTENLYVQAGLMRTSVGPSFDNSVVVGPQAPAAGHLSVTYQNDWFAFSSLLLDLIAQEYYDAGTGALKRLSPVDLPLGKYLMLQTARISPTDWMDFGMIQTVVTGELLHWYYMIPFPLNNLFYAAQLSGDYDTSFIGLFGQVHLPFGLSLYGTFYVDDWDSFSALAQGKGMLIDFNSAQNKFALDAVLSYCPPIDVLEKVSLEYIMVTPYTYTHAHFYDVNWIMYTNAGRNLGTILEPNSDLLELKALLLPVQWMTVNLFGRMVRHGNASTGFTNGDGTIYDDGFNGGTPTFVGVPSRFLTQDVIETTVQAGLSAGVDFRFDWGRITGRLGYTFENVWNKDLVAGAGKMSHFVSLSAGYRF